MLFYFLRNQDELEGAVLELGSGVGLCGILSFQASLLGMKERNVLSLNSLTPYWCHYDGSWQLREIRSGRSRTNGVVIKAHITVVTLRGAVELREWLNRVLLLRSLRVKISQQHVGIGSLLFYTLYCGLRCSKVGLSDHDEVSPYWWFHCTRQGGK